MSSRHKRLSGDDDVKALGAVKMNLWLRRRWDDVKKSDGSRHFSLWIGHQC